MQFAPASILAELRQRCQLPTSSPASRIAGNFANLKAHVQPIWSVSFQRWKVTQTWPPSPERKIKWDWDSKSGVALEQVRKQHQECCRKTKRRMKGEIKLPICHLTFSAFQQTWFEDTRTDRNQIPCPTHMPVTISNSSLCSHKATSSLQCWNNTYFEHVIFMGPNQQNGDNWQVTF